MGDCIVFFESGDSMLTIRGLSRPEAKEKVALFKKDKVKSYYIDPEEEKEKLSKKKKSHKKKESHSNLFTPSEPEGYE